MAGRQSTGADPDDGEEKAADSKPVIVGIGASAGGVQALQVFFAAIPEAVGAAFVVIVHLDPDNQSELSSSGGVHAHAGDASHGNRETAARPRLRHSPGSPLAPQ